MSNQKCIRSGVNRNALLGIMAIFSWLLLTAGSCMEVKDPEFVKMKDWRITTESGALIVHSKAQLYNPNKISFKLSNIAIDVFVDGNKIGVMNQESPVKVAKMNSFEIPLNIRLSKNQNLFSIVSGVFQIAKNQKMKFDYNGFIELRAAGIKVKVPVDGFYDLNLKDMLDEKRTDGN